MDKQCWNIRQLREITAQHEWDSDLGYIDEGEKTVTMETASLRQGEYR